MAEVVFDASVLVGYLDANDVQHARASALIERLERIEVLIARSSGLTGFASGILVCERRGRDVIGLALGSIAGGAGLPCRSAIADVEARSGIT